MGEKLKNSYYYEKVKLKEKENLAIWQTLLQTVIKQKVFSAA